MHSGIDCCAVEPIESPFGLRIMNENPYFRIMIMGNGRGKVGEQRMSFTYIDMVVVDEKRERERDRGRC